MNHTTTQPRRRLPEWQNQYVAVSSVGAALRKEYPLHYFVFRQTASHLPHEGNVEQYFSLGGRLSDPNMNPQYLAILVSIGANAKVFMPSTKDIRQQYLKTFSKNGKLLETDMGVDVNA